MSKVKTSKSSKSNSFFLKVLLLSLFVFTFWFYINKSNKTSDPVSTTTATSQLSSAAEKYEGMGTASKSYSTNKKTKEAMSEVNVTAFLDKPTKGTSYFVVLKGNGSDLSDKFLGEMKLSGDVYSLNYVTQDNLSNYQGVIVIKEVAANIEKSKFETIVLSGTFNQ